jgi:hypothetical protein
MPLRWYSGSLAEHGSLQSVRYAGSNISFLFIKVQAMTSIFAASFTRIFVPIPRSRSLPLSLFVK